MAEQTIGLQLYTVRDETAKDFKLTLRRVSEMGYPAVEFAGYGDIDSKDMATLLADVDLRATSS
ncbi:MAG TPA: sugar phosphate isomerase/epimerase, partial [Ktedonobacteraceae bacterium]